MIKHNQDGAINPLLLPLIIAGVLFISALIFGGWAYSSRQDFKNNTDQKIGLAVTAAEASESERKDKEFAEIAKSPLKTYAGPEQFGSLKLQYPKTWSGYVSAIGNENLEGYFNPNVVPDVADENATFALRIQVLDQTYDNVIAEFDGQEGIVATAYALPKLPNVVGLKLSGQIEQDKQGVMIILPVRDKTIKLFTESKDFENDFNNIILANLTFSP